MAHPFRYTLILSLVALGTGLAAVGGWRYARASAPVNGPIILISIDTLRADHLPVYGYQRVQTPAIDRLAADGVVFERAYSHVPQTLPAHVSLLTGRLPFETGVRDNAGFNVPASERLLPEMLRDRGYATAGVVSSYVLRKQTGIGRGFTFFDSEMQPAPPDMAVGELRRDGTASEQIAERWLDRVGTSRAFLFLHLFEPHRPYAPPPQFSHYDPYDAEIAYADEIVGRLMRYLKAHQLYDRSTIVLVSDHGEGLGDHGEQEHGLLVYEEVIHVPLIIKPAAGEGAGRRVSDVVQHVDVVPTVLDLAKAPIPGNLRGRSLKPLLDGTGHFERRAVYSESLYGRYHFGWSELTSVTDGVYHYIRAPRPEVYDLRRDPAEHMNLAETPPAGPAAELTAAERPPNRAARRERTDAPDKSRVGPVPSLDDWRAKVEGFRVDLEQITKERPVPEPSAVSPEDHERLAVLGYVGRHEEVPSPPTAESADPKDMCQALESYRSAVDLASKRNWPAALDTLLQLVREVPDMTDAWNQIAIVAVRAGRYQTAITAYKHILAADPSDPEPHLDLAAALLRLKRFDESKQEAEAALDLTSASSDRAAASAHELLARLALARHDSAGARAEAELAQQADPALPMPAYVEGRLLYDDGEYESALEDFEQAIDDLNRSHGRPLENLHFYAADCLARVDRPDEAEAAFVSELRLFPQNTRAWAGLASLYETAGRTDEAEQTLADLVRLNPTDEGFTAAARLWASFGNQQRAAAMRAEAARRSH